MRRVAHALLLVLVMSGLLLPKSSSRTHEAACEMAEDYPETVPSHLADLLPADSPLDDWPADCGGCGDHEDREDDGHGPLHPPTHEDSDGGKCPLHHHHHHHQCLCAAANAWLISDGDRFSLHPPLQGHSLARREHKTAPESPVYLLDRPPMA